jgi:predicted transposase YbfD/YdcC
MEIELIQHASMKFELEELIPLYYILVKTMQNNEMINSINTGFSAENMQFLMQLQRLDSCESKLLVDLINRIGNFVEEINETDM